jgi:Domain of unknown function (DUF4439)
VSALLDAWQAALAAEQQAEFGYALLGPQLSGSRRELAAACWHGHGAQASNTTAALVRAGATPVPAQADYPSLYPVSGPAAARALAIRLETDCASAWRYLFAVAATSNDSQANDRRKDSQQALIAAAVRATRWRGSSVAFPGI